MSLVERLEGAVRDKDLTRPGSKPVGRGHAHRSVQQGEGGHRAAVEEIEGPATVAIAHRGHDALAAAVGHVDMGDKIKAARTN